MAFSAIQQAPSRIKYMLSYRTFIDTAVKAYEDVKGAAIPNLTTKEFSLDQIIG